MRTMMRALALTALSAALLAAYGPAKAEEEVNIDELIKPDSWVSLGAGGLFGDDRRQLGIIGGLRDTGGYLLLDADINRRDDATGTWQTLSISNLGMTSRELVGRYERQGQQGITVEYRQSEREVPYLVNTGVTGIGTATQSVPVPSITPGSGTNYQLGTERTKYGIGFFKYLAPSLKFKVNVANEDKEGNRHGRIGGQPEFAAVPIDWNVRQLDASLEYVGERFQMSGGYNGSWFKNENDLLSATRGATTYYISQPLDSQAHQFFVDGGYSFTPTTRGSFKLSYTHAIQDEHIPTADVAGLASPLAPTSLDGEVNTTLVQLGLTARPMPKLNLLANLRYHDVSDETPAWLIITSPPNSAETHSTPLSYTTLSGKLEGTYNLTWGYNLIAGVDYSSQDRTVPVGQVVGGVDQERYVPFRSDLDETTYRIQLRKSLSETLNGSVAFLRSERDGSAYSQAHHSIGGINPINIADRERNKWRVMVDWSPVPRLNLQFNVEDAQDDYGPSSNPYGLRDGSARLYSIDADYSISDRWRITAWYSRDETKAHQFNGRWDRFTENHEIDRDAQLKDTGDSVGLGLRGRITPRLNMGADLQWTRTKNQYHDTVIPIGEGGDPDTGYPAGVTPLPDIKNTLTRISLFAEYAWKKNADLRLDVIHERWKTDDWTWQFSDGSPFTFGTTNDGTTVYTYPKQNSTFVGARYIHKFQ